ncbi:hypothetical protein A33K_13628 [Burkholderia humptydooensis MSMB43]|uniref:Uncharacterized protein n=1 Tax=Burkholderia humptydooensis MSMB43 TaxID=441157 RepID=A0ABN0GCM2_9BURK|nr:hypothetical protein A33K_13628 [Burkholderia humptydooensis MSMB43]
MRESVGCAGAPAGWAAFAARRYRSSRTARSRRVPSARPAPEYSAAAALPSRRRVRSPPASARREYRHSTFATGFAFARQSDDR